MNIDFRTLPCLLFTPGTKPQHFNKAQELSANGIILDLEDSVAENDKNSARAQVLQYLATPKPINTVFIRVVRINALTTLFGIKDISALLEAKPLYLDAIMLPKLESAETVHILTQLLAQTKNNISLMAIIESGKGINNLINIIDSCPSLKAVAFGGADYTTDLGGIPLNWESVFYVRTHLVNTAASRGLAVYDQPYFDFKDMQGLATETEKVKNLGFSGKLAIHPEQINIIQKAFIPSTQQVAEAQNIISTYEQAGGKACQYNGKMIDVPVYKAAQKLLALARNLS